MLHWFQRYRDRPTIIWMYVYTLVPAILLSLYGEFMSFSFKVQIIWSVVLGICGACIGIWSFRYVYYRNIYLKLVLLFSLICLILGTWLMIHRYHNPYKYMKGAKITQNSEPGLLA